jgi:hypothetical protein
MNALDRGHSRGETLGEMKQLRVFGGREQLQVRDVSRRRVDDRREEIA